MSYQYSPLGTHHFVTRWGTEIFETKSYKARVIASLLSKTRSYRLFFQIFAFEFSNLLFDKVHKKDQEKSTIVQQMTMKILYKKNHTWSHFLKGEISTFTIPSFFSEDDFISCSGRWGKSGSTFFSKIVKPQKYLIFTIKDHV